MDKKPYELMFERLSASVVNKQVVDVKPVDNNLCLKITFTDGSYFIIDTMPTDIKKDVYMPVLQYYGEDGSPVNFWENNS